MPFSGPLRTEWNADGVTMTVLEAIEYTDKNGRVWRVPAGFVTDGASIPEQLWSVLGSPFTGKYRLAAVFHDAAYNTLGVTRWDADDMLLAAMLECGCSRLHADLIYDGVRLGGLAAYTEDQAKAATKASA